MIIQEAPQVKVEDYSAEDIAAVKGPGMVQSMLDIRAEEDSESDDGGNEVEHLQAKLKKVGMSEAIERRNEKEREEASKQLKEAATLLSQAQEPKKTR